MLKISRLDAADGSIVLALEGTLVGAWVRELETACIAAVANLGRVSLDLSGVTFVDRAGAELLIGLRADPRVRFESVSGFVAEMLKGRPA